MLMHRVMMPIITWDKSLYMELLVLPFRLRTMLISVAEFPSNDAAAMRPRMIALMAALVVSVGGVPSPRCNVPLYMGWSR